MAPVKKQQEFSPDIQYLKDQIYLANLDRELYIKEKEDILKEKKDERAALRIGNDCLQHMRSTQLNMPVTLNAAVFENHCEKSRMRRIPLLDSIPLNDSMLFKYGKRLLKEDCISKQLRANLHEKKMKLDEAHKEAVGVKGDYERKLEAYLHKQTMVEDSKARELTTKLLHQRLQLILDELNKENMATPTRIKKKEKEIKDTEKELETFTALRNRAMKMVVDGAKTLDPVNEEIADATRHFETLINDTRDELETRRKDCSLAKFLAQRENNGHLYDDETSIVDVQLQRRGKHDSVFTLINKLKDTVMVSNIDNVVDCFLDQNDVAAILKAEKEALELKNFNLRKRLDIAKMSNVFLIYNDEKSTREGQRFIELLEEEAELIKAFEKPSRVREKQDKLNSSIMVAIHAIAEKLRPIQLESLMNKVHGNLDHDMDVVVEKAQRMVTIIKENTVPVGPVKPLMLSLFKEERVPVDSIRAENIHGSMESFRSYQMDTPGLLSRDMLKKSAHSILQEERKKKKEQSKKLVIKQHLND